MKKKIISITLVFVLCFCLYTPVFATGTYSNFTAKNNYSSQFTDVESAHWFAKYVEKAFEYGLLQGVTETRFAPNDNITIAQTIALAVRLHSVFTTGAEPDVIVAPGGNWYDPYVSYALSNDLISSSYKKYNSAALRSEVAVILSKALPYDAFDQRRVINDGAIPDVAMSASYSASVYLLYRAGVLSGNDSSGTFNPNSTVRRSEIAAICVRIADPSERFSDNLEINTGKLTAQQISEKCAPAVFTINIYSYNGRLRGTGSGFFISSDGYAITNYHVAAAGLVLVVTTLDGKVFDRIDDIIIIDTDKKNDLALIKVNGTGFPYLEPGDSSAAKQGQQVYAIGSPIGLESTLSQGIVSNSKRVINGVEFVQISVPIAHGSSGGALIDEFGKVIGVTTAGFMNAGADLNLAVPINRVQNLDRGSTNIDVLWNDNYYPGFSQALDFGAFSGVRLMSWERYPLGCIFEYDATDFHDALFWEDSDFFARSLGHYCLALVCGGFVQTRSDDFGMGRYETDSEWIEISYDLRGAWVITVIAGHKLQFYNEFPMLPDLGWYAGMEVYEGPYEINRSIAYNYRWRDYYNYSELIYMLSDYFDILESRGFTFIGGHDGTFIFDGHRLSVVFGIYDRTLNVDIVAY